MFTPVFYGTVNQLLINLVRFIFVFFLSLHKEYLTNFVKITLPSVDIFTCGYSLKVS